MSINDETNPFTYKKSNNYIAKTFRQINEVLDLTEQEIKTLIIFGILRMIDLILTYIFFNKNNAYYAIKFIDYFILILSFIFSSSVYRNKENVKQRAAMLSIFFNFAFLCFDVISFILYFVFKVNNLLLFLSFIVNGIWLVKTVVLMSKITLKFMKVLKERKHLGYDSYLRKKKF